MTDPFNGPGNTPAADFRRDRWGRPLIMQPDGKRKPYQRASGAAKPIEDTWGLELWARRNVAYGLASDPSLVARILAVGASPHEWDQDAKKKVNAVCEDASKVAQAHRAADIGTALHAILEQHDRGLPITAGGYQPDVDAYVKALDGLGMTMLPEYVECRLVCDELELAGTADNIARLDEAHVIADKKTGASVEYAILGHAAQLAAYAHSSLYDVTAEQRLPTPDLDRESGFIIHLPAGQGRCDIYRLDLREGYAAAELANRVRVIRKAARTWQMPAAAAKFDRRQCLVGDCDGCPQPTDGCPGCVDAKSGTRQSTSPKPDRRQRLRERYQMLANEDQLRFVAIGADPDDLDAVEAALNAVDPFAQTAELRTFTAIPPAAPAAVPLDEGPTATPDEIQTLRAAWELLEPDQAEWVRRVVADAGNLSVDQHQSQRRVTIGTALVQLAVAGWGDTDVVAALLGHATDEHVTSLAELPAHGARRFAHAADLLIGEQLTIAFEDGQTVVVEANTNQQEKVKATA